MPRSGRLGAGAEDRAADYFREIGYTIVTRNYVAPGISEIDLIAMDGEVLVFIEVKARKSRSLVGPEESVSIGKQRRLWEAANHYLGNVVEKEVDARFDVLAIDGDVLRHHVDAFRP